MTHESPYFGYIVPYSWQEPVDSDPDDDQNPSTYVSPEEGDDF